MDIYSHVLIYTYIHGNTRVGGEDVWEEILEILKTHGNALAALLNFHSVFPCTLT